MLSAGALAACGGAPRLASAPKAPQDLSGDWILERSRSDDVRAKIRPKLSRMERDLNRNIQRAREAGAIDEPLDRSQDGPPVDAKPGTGTRTGSEGRSGDEGSTVHWIRQQQRMEGEALVAFLSPASELRIERLGGQYRFQSDKGEGARRFIPGEGSAVFNTFGRFDVMSGWDQSSLVVSSIGKGGNDMKLLERYTLLDDGASLEAQVTAKIPNLGKFQYRFVYRRRT